MFDFFRDHSRIFQGLLVLVIFPSFVFFGVQGYSRFTDAANASIASVDGRGITRAELESVHQRNVERVRRQMQGVDVKLFDTPAMKRESLDGLLRERVLLAATNQMHLSPTDEQLLDQFRRDPQFASLRNPDGTVNRDALAAQGLSSEGFVYQLRQESGMRQVLQAIAASELPVPTVANTALNAFFQRREVELQRFDSKDQRAKVSPSDADLEAYYKANEAQFRAPEQADIEYVTLDLDTLKKGVTVNDKEAKEYYEANAARYTSAEERRASHILLKADKDTPAAEKAKIKAKAEGLLAEVRKAPATFAEVAKKNSQDTSAAQGGDLDFFGRGSMVKPFEDAVFAMKQGEISNVVETDFGFHIIQLTAVRGGDKKSFESVRAEIDDEIKKQLARKKYAEVAEQFSNLVYEQADSLQPVIEKLKLERSTATVQRTPAPGAKGALASAKLLESVFGNEAVRNKRNTEAVEVAPNQMAAARVVKHSPEHTLPLAEVKDRVRERVVAVQAADAARKEGMARLAALKGGDSAALPTTVTLSRNQMQGQPSTLVDAVLRADATKLPTVIGVDLADAGYAVVRINKVLPRDLAAGPDKDLFERYAQTVANAQAQAYYAALKTRFKAEVKDKALAASEPAASAPAKP